MVHQTLIIDELRYVLLISLHSKLLNFVYLNMLTSISPFYIL